MPSGIYTRTSEMKTGKYIRIKKFCSIEDCNEKHYCKGLCRKHWHKQYNQAHKDKSIKYNKQRYKDNREKRLEQCKQYQTKNKEHYAEYNRQYNKEHKEQKTIYNKQYRQTSAGKLRHRIGSHNRRAITKDLTLATVQRVYEGNILKYGTLTCILCGKVVEFKDSSLEHLTPLSRDGNNDFNNLGVAHKSCNFKKGTMTLKEWDLKKENKKDLHIKY